MLYPDNFEEKIGFDVVRRLILEHCLSPQGVERVDGMRFMSDMLEIIPALESVEEFRQLLLFDEPFPAQDFYDLRETLKRLRIDGTHIELEELACLRGFILSMTQIFVYFKVRHEENRYPRLWAMCAEMPLQRDLTSAINRIMDDKGQLRDNASEELARIKSAMNRLSRDADHQIRKILTAAKQDGIVKEDAEMTVRNGRLCIPVTAQFKRRLKGFVHDESATGQTVFIEPTEVFDANNELKELQNAEQREIIRILTEISDTIRPLIDDLLDAQSLMGRYDFLRAKALFAIDIDASVPHIHNKTLAQWYQAKHPLLYLNFKKNHKEVVPLDIKLIPEKRILIISGPNAGGKSVCLKSVGLLQYMMQCGLPVPMMSTSDMGIFENLFIDIGDEQSIDNDLSTYSSHLQNLKAMDENLNAKSLFLIDEFGSGTEPTLGGALAEAILERYYDTQAFGIITTHYGNLKMFSDTHPEAENGAMLFDTNALQPLYKLKIGKPGSSFTYEIARQIGLDPQIIDHATQKSGTAQIDYERKLEEIEITQIETEQQLKMVRAADEQLAVMIDEYAEKFAQLDKQRKEILTKAKNEPNSIVESVKKSIENAIREIKESTADTEKTKVARQQVQTFKKEMQKEIEHIEKAEAEAVKSIMPIHRKKPVEKRPTPEEVQDKTIRVGDSVYMPDSQIAGEVTQIDGNDVTISFHSVNFRTKMDKLLKISKKEARSVERGHVSQFNTGSIADALNKKLSQFSTTLDVRGQRAEEMVHNLEEYLDEAEMLGVGNLRILHGKGNGILRSVVRQYLTKRKDVAEFQDEMLELGGAGITVVRMKK